MRTVDEVEDMILNDLGPRDLVKAKQVSKDWAQAVRRYIGQMKARSIYLSTWAKRDEYC